MASDTRTEAFSELVGKRAGSVLRLAVLGHRVASNLVAAGLYAAVILAFGPALAVSSNYAVMLPLAVAALTYGLVGGTVAGILGLPANLLLFSLIGHPEFSPASKLIAEISGVTLGVLLGLLGDYFKRLDAEIDKRAVTELSLRKAVADRELLLAELHHRVKNNLNVVISLVRLQRNRSDDPAFVEAANELTRRIFAIALVHDRLYRSAHSPGVDPSDYVPALVKEIASFYNGKGVHIAAEIEAGLGVMPIDTAVSIGLFINEAVTNAMKHAFDGVDDPRVKVTLGRADGDCVLRVADNGRGLSGTADGEAAKPDGESGLGMKILMVLAQGLRGTFSVSSPGGTSFVLRFPENAETGHGSGGSRQGPPPDL